MGIDFKNFGAPDITGSSRPPNRNLIVPDLPPRPARTSGIDGDRFQKFRRARHHWLVPTAKANLYGAGSYAGTIKHVPEPHAGPERIAHPAVCPLSAGDAWRGVKPRISGALIDRSDLHSRKAVQNISKRQR